LGIFISALVIAYFYLADRYFFSTRSMSRIFRYLLTTDDAQTAWLHLGICVAAAGWKWRPPVIKAVDFLSAHVIKAVLLSVMLLGLGSVFLYHMNAFSMDEYVEVFQARIFAAGQLSAHLPAAVVDWLIPPGFNGGFLLASRTTGEAIGGYWPGFSLILSLFQILDIPWLCNPCLSGISIFLIYRITLEITADRRAAGWSVLFTLASGTFVAYGISLYSMQGRLAANLLFVWFLLRPGPYRCFAAGVSGSIALLIHSPLPHVVFAAPWIIAMARCRAQRRYLPHLVAGYLPGLLLAAVVWLPLRAAIVGSQSTFEPIGPSLVAALSLPTSGMLDLRLAATVKLWLWASPCLLLFAILGRLRGGADQRVRLLFLSALATFIGYFFVVFDQGHGWGYRYFQAAWGVIPILAGCAMTERCQSNDRLAAFAGSSAILGLLVIVPFQLLQIERVISRHSAQLPKPQRPNRYVYFVREAGGFYEADLVQMDPLLRGPDLILFSRGASMDAELRKQNWPEAVLVAHTASIDQWQVDADVTSAAKRRGAEQIHIGYDPGEKKSSKP
jgi:hypothetical protein